MGVCYNTPMADIILKSGGYKKLKVFAKSEVIYEGTVVFCRRFLPAHGDRTVDQMTQAARSCKQNLAEGSASSGTSKETEIKLTGVAKATLDELLEDYLDYLKSHGMTEWPLSDSRKAGMRDWTKSHNEWSDYATLFAQRDAETLCNLMITLIHQVHFMIQGMLSAQEADFKEHGGIRERMTRARHESRADSWEDAVYSKLLMSSTERELAQLEAQMCDAIRRKDWGLRKQRGWLR